MVYRAVERREEGWACQEQGEQDPVVYHSASDGAISTTISNVSTRRTANGLKGSIRDYLGSSWEFMRLRKTVLLHTPEIVKDFARILVPSSQFSSLRVLFLFGLKEFRKFRERRTNRIMTPDPVRDILRLNFNRNVSISFLPGKTSLQ